MSEEVDLFSSEKEADRASVATLLRELADNVEVGRVRFRRESQTIACQAAIPLAGIHARSGEPVSSLIPSEVMPSELHDAS